MPQQNTIGNQIADFFYQLKPDFDLPEGISIMHPYHESPVRKVVSVFYQKYHNNALPHIPIFGINPGRFGAGITGISFTDPVRLLEACNIPNDFAVRRQELSCSFIYEMIAAYGGPEKFYNHFLLTSLCPLGFVKEGKNLNYYDQKDLLKSATPFILEAILRQKTISGNPDGCICLGEGKNYKYFCQLNKKYKLFSKIIPLPHPRYVMQYKRNRKEEYIDLYIKKMKEAVKLLQ